MENRLGMMEKKIKLITHSGGFHADDVFATATLLLYLKKSIDEVEIIRTRDQKLIETGDYVFDVGFEYDPTRKRFDHHQEEGAGIRENGIQYASFGLVWKEYGTQITGSIAVANALDRCIVQTIDGLDTGTVPMKVTQDTFYFYTTGNLIGSFEPSWGAPPEVLLEAFKKAAGLALVVLQNEIRQMTEKENARASIVETYNQALDKRLIVFPHARGWSRIFISDVLLGFSDTSYFVRQHSDDNSWQAICVQGSGYKSRKPFPKTWAGKAGTELARISHVSDARFCHRGRFLCIAESKEGAIHLAEKALEHEESTL